MQKVKYFTVAFVALCVVSVFIYVFGVTQINKLRADRAVTLGEKYISEVYADYTLGGKICQGVDTDQDGYVTCTFRVVKNDADKEIILKCPTYFSSFFGTECKSGAMVIQN